MKTLMLLRHAKSAWPGNQVSDHERTLNKRGITSAEKMGKYIEDEKQVPDMIYCSTATRAHQTLELVIKNFSEPPEYELENYLYLCTAEELLLFLKRLPDRYGRVMIIAHNPGLMDFTEKAMGRPLPHHKFSTCALAELDYPISSWNKISFKSGELTRFTTPAMLKT